MRASLFLIACVCLYLCTYFLFFSWSLPRSCVKISAPRKPLGAPNNSVDVKLSLDGESFLDSVVSYSYYAEPTLGDAKPNKGPVGKELQVCVGLGYCVLFGGESVGESVRQTER